jgi:ABC-type multidrug transport system ATPase subunit
MSLLALEHVGRTGRVGAHEHILLCDVSLEVHPREVVAVWGPRRCGRSTLLRVAAGIERPDAGVVRWQGRDLREQPDALGNGIGYCRRGGTRGDESREVLEELVVAALARGLPGERARAHALRTLARVGASASGGYTDEDLDGAEAIRVALARALSTEPSLLLVDDPIRGVDLDQRDEILILLRSLAEDGLAVLVATDDATGLWGADRALSLSGGVLRGERMPELAPVVPLRRDTAA